MNLTAAIITSILVAGLVILMLFMVIMTHGSMISHGLSQNLVKHEAEVFGPSRIKQRVLDHLVIGLDLT